MRRIEIEYRRDLQHSYLVWKAEQEQERQYPARMIAENHLSGLLDCSLKKIDEQLLFYYDVTSQISLAEKCRHRKLSASELLTVIRCLLQTLSELEEYLLPADFLCMDIEYIFVDPLLEKVQFCYMPGECKAFKLGFRKLMEDLLPFLDHKDQQGVLAGYGFYHYAVEQEFILEEMYQQLAMYEPQGPAVEEEVKQETAPSFHEEERQHEEARQRARQHQEALDAFFGEDEEEDEKTVRHPVLITLGVGVIVFYLLAGWYLWKNFSGYLLLWMIAGGIMVSVSAVIFLIQCIRKDSDDTDFGQPGKNVGVVERTPNNRDMGEEQSNPEAKRKQDRTAPERVPTHSSMKNTFIQEETCLLSETWQKDKQLPGSEGTERYVLVKKGMEHGRPMILEQSKIQVVGSSKDTADVVIPASTVSRMHARLTFQSGVWYLKDLNSRNGTWVNEEELIAGKERELKEGDELCFADQYYYFRKL